MSGQQPRRTLYGRRRGKPLRPGRRELTDSLLPKLLVLPAGMAAGSLQPLTLFPERVREVWLEVGFGNGEHLAALARAHPEVGFIGCEPFINGVARLLSYVDEDGLDNVRLVTDDAAVLLAALAEASIARAFTLFPDPWPKKRHHKRRFVRAENIARMARALQDGARWRLATDDMGYCRWMLFHLTAAPQFAWTARGASDWRRRPDDWPATRYEEKALAAGRAPAYLEFRRRPRREA